ncbi:MAG: hypothetical protein JRI68_08630 [Deltaproteobacteria bacterium]|nr:hypothetical protein [Deltaproteobacteria bacterium]
MKRSILLSLLALAALCLTAGCHPPWQVVRQIVPNPMLGQHDFVIMPIDFAGVQVGSGSEASYLADKDGDSRRSWADDKAMMNQQFASAFRGHAQEDGIRVMPPSQAANFIIHPKVVFIEPGFYTHFVNRGSEVQMFITISAADGTILDELTMAHGTAATMTTAAISFRLEDDAQSLGRYAARYLLTRVTGAED